MADPRARRAGLHGRLRGAEGQDQRTGQPCAAPVSAGTLGWAIEKFTGSDDYKARAVSTRDNDRRVYDELRRVHGAGFLHDLMPKHVKIMRDYLRDTFSSSTADMGIGLLSIVWVLCRRAPRRGAERQPDLGHPARPQRR